MLWLIILDPPAVSILLISWLICFVILAALDTKACLPHSFSLHCCQIFCDLLRLTSRAHVAYRSKRLWTLAIAFWSVWFPCIGRWNEGLHNLANSPLVKLKVHWMNKYFFLSASNRLWVVANRRKRRSAPCRIPPFRPFRWPRYICGPHPIYLKISSLDCYYLLKFVA